jgi:putative flippase GtrA
VSGTGSKPFSTSVEGVIATHCGSVQGVTPDRADRPNIREFLRYAVVGGVQNGLNLLAFAAAVWAGVPYLLAAVIAAVVALSFSFVLNHLWTFPSPASHVPTRAVRFAIVWVAIVGLTLLALAILVDVAQLPHVPAQAIAILFGAPLSYAAQRRWTFGLRILLSHGRRSTRTRTGVLEIAFARRREAVPTPRRSSPSYAELHRRVGRCD